jgi:hypothetical protein
MSHAVHALPARWHVASVGLVLLFAYEVRKLAWAADHLRFPRLVTKRSFAGHSKGRAIVPFR